MHDRGVRNVPYDRFRRVTERRMVQSVTTKPQVTLHASASLAALERELARYRLDRPDAGLSLTAALLAAFARGAAGSRLNGTVNDRVIALYDHVDIGVAVDVEGTLVVPVVRDADRRGVAELGSEVRRLTDQARAGALRPEDVEGATFTVTSLGALGVESFTPIVNPPQLAILGVGAIREEVTLVDGVIGTARRVGLSLSFDHAATDGADAARVLQEITGSVESPAGLRWLDEDHSRSAQASSSTTTLFANPT